MKKGFTLIELLTVVILIAVLSIIIIPIIYNAIISTKKGIVVDSAYGIIQQADLFYNDVSNDDEIDEIIEDMLFFCQKGVCINVDGQYNFDYKDKGLIKYAYLKAYSTEDYEICVTDGTYSAYKKKGDAEVKSGEGVCDSSLNVIEDITNTPLPKFSFEVVQGSKASPENEWYTSKEVVVRTTIYTVKNEENDIKNADGFAIDKDSIVIKVNNKKVKGVLKSSTFSTRVYDFVITDNGINTITVEAADMLGTKSNATFSVKKDDVEPTIIIKNKIFSQPTDAIKMVEGQYGLSGIKELICDNVKTLDWNTRSSNCNITNGAGVTISKNLNFTYEYNAGYSICQRTVSVCVCDGHYKTTSHSNDHTGDTTEYHSRGTCCTNYHTETDIQKYNCNYNCNAKGGTLNTSNNKCYLE